VKSYNFHLHRIWWQWKGSKPDPRVVAFMNKTYPPGWTYADFAAQFHAEFYGKYRPFDFERKLSRLDPNEWADIFAASGAKFVRHISM
jgi:alpha-L-fucosidase